jgi:predicted transcriptional regulator of viral defense system
MGRKKHIDGIRQLFEKSRVVDAKSIERAVKAGKNTGQYHKQLIRNLVRQGHVKRLTKGCYTAHSDPSLMVYCLKPAYLGLQDALSFHNLWEQETIPVILTSKKIRQGIRKVMDSNVLIRRIEPKYMFGFGYHQQDNNLLPYSDIEKTLIDMVHYRQEISKDAINEIKKKVNRQKLEDYLKKYPKRTKTKTLGIIYGRKQPRKDYGGRQ